MRREIHRIALLACGVAALSVCLASSLCGAKSIFDDAPLLPPTQPATAPAAPLVPVQPAPAAVQPGPMPAPVQPVPAPAIPSIVAPPIIPVTPDLTPPLVKIAPPDDAHRAGVMKMVKEVFDKEYADKTPAGKRALAQVLLSEAEKIANNYIARFVLLQEALAGAIGGADIDICRKALDDIGHFYTVDVDEMTFETLSKLQGYANEELLGGWELEAAQGMIERESYQTARRVVKLVYPKIARSKDPVRRNAFKSLESTLAEYDKARPAIEKLKTDGADPLANLAAGKFYCFFGRNYAKGLPLLCKGGDPVLKDLAQRGLANPVDAVAKAQLAGSWWTVGQEQAYVSFRAALLERANYWYALALPELTGLKKALAEKRLAETPTPRAPSNMLSKMTATAETTPVEGGAIQLSRGRLNTPEEVTVPFRADFVAKTDSTNIRLGFNRGVVILNWESRRTELRHHDPVTGHITAIRGAGEIPVNEFVQVTWIVLPEVSKVYVNGQERGAVRGNYKNVHGFVSIYPASGSTITVKSVNVTTGASVR